MALNINPLELLRAFGGQQEQTPEWKKQAQASMEEHRLPDPVLSGQAPGLLGLRMQSQEDVEQAVNDMLMALPAVGGPAAAGRAWWKTPPGIPSKSGKSVGMGIPGFAQQGYNKLLQAFKNHPVKSTMAATGVAAGAAPFVENLMSNEEPPADGITNPIPESMRASTGVADPSAISNPEMEALQQRIIELESMLGQTSQVPDDAQAGGLSELQNRLLSVLEGKQQEPVYQENWLERLTGALQDVGSGSPGGTSSLNRARARSLNQGTSLESANLTQPEQLSTGMLMDADKQATRQQQLQRLTQTEALLGLVNQGVISPEIIEQLNADLGTNALDYQAFENRFERQKSLFDQINEMRQGAMGSQVNPAIFE